MDGQNVVIDVRWAQGNYDRYAEPAAELVFLKVDVLASMSAFRRPRRRRTWRYIAVSLRPGVLLAPAIVLWLTAVSMITASPVRAQEIVTLATRPRVTQSYFLARVPEKSEAVAVLFPGGGGDIRLRSEGGDIKFSQGNFLVRVRGEFVKRGIVVAVVDAPSDERGGWGMSDEFRFSKEHLADVQAVIADLGKRYPDLPIFLVGTSRGSISAASLGARIDRGIAGVVLTSSMFRATNPRARESGPGLSRFDFGTIKVPVLIVHHREDACPVSPYGDAASLAKMFPLVSVTGGLPPTSDACEPMSPHGYLGRETETVDAIVNWMLKRPYAREIPG